MWISLPALDLQRIWRPPAYHRPYANNFSPSIDSDKQFEVTRFPWSPARYNQITWQIGLHREPSWKTMQNKAWSAGMNRIHAVTIWRFDEVFYHAPCQFHKVSQESSITHQQLWKAKRLLKHYYLVQYENIFISELGRETLFLLGETKKKGGKTKESLSSQQSNAKH